EALVVPAVVAEKESLIGGVDDDRVLGEVVCIEPVEHAPDVVVDRGDTAQVILDVPGTVDTACVVAGLRASGGGGVTNARLVLWARVLPAAAWVLRVPRRL